MENIREKAKEFLKKEADFWVDEGGDIYADYVTPELLVKFAREMCELQKQECADNAFIDCSCDSNESCPGQIDRDSILNCKNVCDEY